MNVTRSITKFCWIVLKYLVIFVLQFKNTLVRLSATANVLIGLVKMFFSSFQIEWGALFFVIANGLSRRGFWDFKNSYCILFWTLI